jgi:hypothetical protein
MNDPQFDWDWLVSVGFRPMAGAPDGVLMIQEQLENGVRIEVWPQYKGHSLEGATWRIVRHIDEPFGTTVPWWYPMISKNDVAGLMAALHIKPVFGD